MIPPGSSPLEEMGRIGYVPTEMRTAAPTLEDHTVFMDALPTQYEVEARNLACRDRIARAHFKAAHEQHHRRPGIMKEGSNAGHKDIIMYAGGSCSGGSSRKEGGGSGKEYHGRRGQRGLGGRGTIERAVVAMAAAPKPPAEVSQSVGKCHSHGN